MLWLTGIVVVAADVDDIGVVTVEVVVDFRGSCGWLKGRLPLVEVTVKYPSRDPESTGVVP